MSSGVNATARSGFNHYGKEKSFVWLLHRQGGLLKIFRTDEAAYYYLLSLGVDTKTGWKRTEASSGKIIMFTKGGQGIRYRLEQWEIEA